MGNRSNIHPSPPVADLVLADSITRLPETGSRRPVVICGSHGGLSAAVYALHAGVKGAIFNDAGIGKNNAGIAGLEVLERCGVMAAAVDAFTARIGLAGETANGLISHANPLAVAAGVRIGMDAAAAARVMAGAGGESVCDVPPDLDIREVQRVVFTTPEGYRIVTLDSNAMVAEANRHDVVMTGSHGGVVGNRPAVKFPVIGAFYNDAGVGKDKAGISRLAWLQENRIPGATVDANSARIGIGLDTYRTGIVSHHNDLAGAAGIRVGMRASEAARRILAGMASKTFPRHS